MRPVMQSLTGGPNTPGRPSPSPCLCSRVPAALPEPGLLQSAPALRVPLRLPRSPLRRGHSRGGIRPPELQASPPTLGRGTPQPAQEQCGQRKHHGQGSAPSTTAAAGQVSPLPQWALSSWGGLRGLSGAGSAFGLFGEEVEVWRFGGGGWRVPLARPVLSSSSPAPPEGW